MVRHDELWADVYALAPASVEELVLNVIAKRKIAWFECVSRDNGRGTVQRLFAARKR